MKKKLVLLLLAVLIYTSLARSQAKDQLSNEQKEWISKADRHEKNGWIYLHIEGKPEERGFQHGYLLAKEIKEAIIATGRVWQYETALDWQWMVQKSAEIFNSKIDAENMQEMEGIVEGMKAAGEIVTRDEIVAYNGSTEFTGYWWPMVKDTVSPNSPNHKKESCSSFIATGSMTADGGIVLGHNTMSSFYYPLCNVILDILPEKGYRILMQSVAGLIHSETDFFITSAGGKT